MRAKIRKIGQRGGEAIEEQGKADGGGKPAHGKCAIRGVADSRKRLSFNMKRRFFNMKRRFLNMKRRFFFFADFLIPLIIRNYKAKF